MKEQKQQPSSSRQSVFLLVLAFFLIVLVGYPSLSFLTNLISGAGTSDGGTVILNITGKTGGISEEVARKEPRRQGKLLSFDLEVIPQQIIEKLNQHDGKIIQLLLRNRGSRTLDLTLSTNVPILTITEQKILLPPGGEKTATVLLNTDHVGIFVGRLTIEGLFAFKQLPVSIQIDLPGDHTVSVVVPSSLKTILPGQNIFAMITLTDLQDGQLDLRYVIQDSDQQILVEEREQKPVTGGTLTFQKTFALPDTLEIDDYYLVVEATQNGKTAQGVDHFAVVDALAEQREFPERLYRESPLSFFLIVVVILLLHVFMVWHKKHYD